MGTPQTYQVNIPRQIATLVLLLISSTVGPLTVSDDGRDMGCSVGSAGRPPTTYGVPVRCGGSVVRGYR